MARVSDEDLFFRKLPPDGERRGNYSVMADLGWAEEKYWRIRDRLIAEGKLVVGKGKGGSVARVVERPSVTSAAAQRTEPVGAVNQEYDLYAPLHATLTNQWARHQRLDHFEAAVTAAQGRRPTGGTWTRPDITGISVRRYTYVQGTHFDLWTFEVKPSWQVTVAGVFEAAAHSKFATRPFVMFHVPNPAEAPEFDRCIAEASRFEIGLISFSDPSDFGSWETHVDAPRRSPDPEHLDDFIATQVPEELRSQLQRWLR